MKKYLRVICSLVCIFILSACSRSASFNGSRTGNDNQLIMEYSVFNATEAQILELNKGDIIDVEVVSDSGELSASIQKNGDMPIYEGKNIPTSSFKVEVEESGTYQIKVTGVKAKGSVSFIKAQATNSNIS